jgi:hypothetical protein
MDKSRGGARFAAGFSAVVCLALMSVLPAVAQNKKIQPYVARNPIVHSAIHFDVSPPLREMIKETPPQFGFHQAEPVLRPKLQSLMAAAKRGGQFVGDPAAQRSILPQVMATIGLNLLGVGVGFGGYVVPDAPTDVNLAVGDTQVVQWVNVSYAVFDKTTGAVEAGPIAGNQLWAGFGGPCQNNNDGDPIVQWDKQAHRWVLAQNVFVSPYMTCVAVSTSPDATGSYYRFAFPQADGFPDYPKWGIWRDAYYQANNDFYGVNGFGAYPCAYDRTKMLAGDSSAQQICFYAPTTFDDSMLPADIDSTLGPTKGEPEVYVGSIDNFGSSGSTIYEYQFHVDFATPANSTFTGFGGTEPITVSTYNLACGGFGACIQQKGVSDQLDSLGDRLMYRLAYRNFKTSKKGFQQFLVSHAVTGPNNQVAERWYEFRAFENSTVLHVYQQSTFAPDTTNRWMGSIAADKMSNILLGYSTSSSSMYPTVSYTGRLRTDPLNTMESEATVFAGTGSQTDTSNRWGDYTSMAIDAADGCTFWYTNQYYTVTTSFDWSTRLASFKFPNCN